MEMTIKGDQKGAQRAVDNLHNMIEGSDFSEANKEGANFVLDGYKLANKLGVYWESMLKNDNNFFNTYSLTQAFDDTTSRGYHSEQLANALRVLLNFWKHKQELDRWIDREWIL